MGAKAMVHKDSAKTVIGAVTFTQRSEKSPVIITGILAGFKPYTVHGFHVHTNPLPTGELNCTAAGAHFNPYNTSHGSIRANISERHVGDLGNVKSDRHGVIKILIADRIIQLYDGVRSIANRTIVIHEMPDDDGKGGFSDSKTTGHAGARVACGVIHLSKHKSISGHHTSHLYDTI